MAGFDLRLPEEIRFGRATPEQQLAGIGRYLFRLDETLRYLFAHIDTDNLTGEALQAIRQMKGETKQ